MSDKPNIFEKIRKEISDHEEKLKLRREVLDSKKRREKQSEADIQELVREGKEIEGFMDDRRYPRWKNWMALTKEVLEENLKTIARTSRSVDETALLTAKIVGQLDILDILENRPAEIDQLFQEYKSKLPKK